MHYIEYKKEYKVSARNWVLYKALTHIHDTNDLWIDTTGKIIIRLGEVGITSNSTYQSHLMRGCFFRITVDAKNQIDIYFYRTTFTEAELKEGYIHSHLSGFSVNNHDVIEYRSGNFCMGQTDIRPMAANILSEEIEAFDIPNKFKNEKDFNKFFESIPDVTSYQNMYMYAFHACTTESTEDGPYKQIKNLKNFTSGPMSAIENRSSINVEELVDRVLARVKELNLFAEFKTDGSFRKTNLPMTVSLDGMMIPKVSLVPNNFKEAIGRLLFENLRKEIPQIVALTHEGNDYFINNHYLEYLVNDKVLDVDHNAVAAQSFEQNSSNPFKFRDEEIQPKFYQQYGEINPDQFFNDLRGTAKVHKNIIDKIYDRFVTSIKNAPKLAFEAEFGEGVNHNLRSLI